MSSKISFWFNWEDNGQIYLYFPHHLFSGFDEIVQMLIENGANVNARDNEEQSALNYAATFGKLFQISVEKSLGK